MDAFKDLAFSAATRLMGVVQAGAGVAALKAVEILVERLYARAAKSPVVLKDDIDFLRSVLPDVKKVIWSAEVKDETAEMRKALQAYVEKAEDILDEFDNRPMPRPPQVLRLNNTPSSFMDRIKGLYGGLEKLKSNENKRRQFVASVEEGLCLEKDDQLPRRPINDELLGRDLSFVGREKVKKEIVTELLSEPLSKPSVILVTGMGGIGKTTLVRNIFHDYDSNQRFQIKKWVCVGDELDPRVVMAKISGRTIEERAEMCSELEGKRFLIVLDDCWKGKLGRWKDLWEPLTHGSDGSKVIITSRSDIRKDLSPAYVKPYPLRILSDKECLQIFESYAFQGGAPSTSSGSTSTARLRKIGTEIVEKKIKGLPLAARVLGASLTHETRESVWKNVLAGGSNDYDDIMSVLMWSYRRLPWYLKQSFAYLSVFPKDYKLQKEHVVWMWMAHDYLKPEDNQTSEDVGLKYFDDLVGASLIQKMQGDEESDVYYNMHDLVHDLAMKVTIGGCFPYKHLSITDNKSSHGCFDKKNLRTLLILCEDADITKLQLQYVRVLLISRERHFALVDEMTHLRYLDLTKVRGDTLSESICGIYNLQTLLLHYCVVNFPSGTWKLPNLRHLMGGSDYRDEEIYEDGIRMTGISNSKSLHTIGCFNLFDEGEDLKELANLNELQGKLKINHLGCVQSTQSAEEAQLKNKKYIEELVLNWAEEPSDTEEEEFGVEEEEEPGDIEEEEEPGVEEEEPGDIAEEEEPGVEGEPDREMTENNPNGILENLRPHESLRTLEILSYRGDQLPSWLKDDYLKYLKKLKLSRLHHAMELPPLGHLPSLEHLDLDYLENVRYIGKEFYGTGADVFPSLKKLELSRMDGLEEWKESGRHKDGIPACFPSLEYLDIKICKKLRSMPHLPRGLKHIFIGHTGLEALPDCPEYCCNIHKLEIMWCDSLRPDEWFRTHRMPSLQKLYLQGVGGCTNLVINYSRKCLRSVRIGDECQPTSITLSNIVPLNEFKEANYQLLSVSLPYLLKEVSIVNSEDRTITAGPLELRTYGGSSTAMMLENLCESMKQDQEYTVNNAVESSVDLNGVYVLKVEPRTVPNQL